MGLNDSFEYRRHVQSGLETDVDIHHCGDIFEINTKTWMDTSTKSISLISKLENGIRKNELLK